MLHNLTIDGEPFTIWLSRTGEQCHLHHDDQVSPVALTKDSENHYTICIDGKTHQLVMARSGDTAFIHFAGNAYEIAFSDAATFFAQAAGGSAEDAITAPMPGAVIAINVAPGDAVGEGEVLAIIESMKLETALKAPRDGIVEAVSYEPGQTFERDAVLIKLVVEDD